MPGQVGGEQLCATKAVWMALHQKFLRHNDILQSTAGGNAIVTADAAVSKDVQANTFVGGASAKFIKAIG
jgi:serine acetyltransferase